MKKLIDFETLCKNCDSHYWYDNVCQAEKDTCPIWNSLPDAVEKPIACNVNRYRVFTGYYDHTGEALFEGDLCTVDSGHSHCDDLTGKIIYVTNKGFYFKYDDDGDEVLLHNIHSDLEKIKGLH